MAEEAAAKKEEGDKKRSLLPVIIGVVGLAAGLGGGIVVERTVLSSGAPPAEAGAEGEAGAEEEAKAEEGGGEHGGEAKAEEGGGEHGGGEKSGGGEHGGGGEGKTAPATDVMSLGSFTVNLRDSGGGRLLMMEISIEAPGNKAKESLTNKQAQLRDAVILLASDYTYLELEGLEGRMRLKDELLKRCNAVLSPEKAERIYFTSFVIQ